MPYRRLPNTDAARLRALKAAFEKGTDLSPRHLAFSQQTLYQIRMILPKFESAVQTYHNDMHSHAVSHQNYPELFHMTRLYISHFIQVLNMCIMRNEMPASVRSFFGLEDYGNKLPRLQTEADLLQWGQTVIRGENERLRRGMHPISNPSVSMVKVKYEQFASACFSLNMHRKNTSRRQEDVAQLRQDVDALLLTLWNEVEAAFSGSDDEQMRRQAAEYGVVYVFRKGERPGDTSAE